MTSHTKPGLFGSYRQLAVAMAALVLPWLAVAATVAFFLGGW